MISTLYAADSDILLDVVSRICILAHAGMFIRKRFGMRCDQLGTRVTFGPMQKVAEELGTSLYEPFSVLTSNQYSDNLSRQQAYRCFACRVRKGSV